MAKPEWGTKRTCTHCGARFYDMNKRPILCPKCGGENEAEVAPKLRRSNRVPKPSKAVAKPVEEQEEESTESGNDEDNDLEEDVMEDTNDLGEDDEDMAEVMEHVESEDDDT